MLGWEREYIQLHRDTTVQSLTVDPQITGGAVSWVDTPLVSAVRHGRVLMVDEVTTTLVFGGVFYFLSSLVKT